MIDFSCQLPGELVVKAGGYRELAKYIKPFGKRCFLVSDPFFVENGLVAELESLLSKDNIETTIYSRVKPNPSCLEIDEGAEVCKKNRCDSVVAVGGGSTIDTGKAIAVMAENEGGSWDFIDREDRPSNEIGKVLPVIVIPTTSGTGTEATHYSVISNPEKHEKGTIISNRIFPDYAVIDAELMITLPPKLTALTGIDALSHCLEAFIGNAATPFSDMVAKEGIRIITRNLPEAVSNGGNLEARKAMAWGSALGGVAIGHAGVGLPHALGQPVGGIADAPHGASIAACLAKVIEFSYMSNFEKFGQLAECIDPSVSGLPLYEKAEKSVLLIERFLDYVGGNITFSEIGLKEADIDKAVEVAMNGYGVNVRNHPRVASEQEIRTLYNKCL